MRAAYRYQVSGVKGKSLAPDTRYLTPALVALAEWPYPIPSRTRRHIAPAPMDLRASRRGSAGRRQACEKQKLHSLINQTKPADQKWSAGFVFFGAQSKGLTGYN